jgi:type II secretory pathway pseudopilin PulG
MREDFHAGNQCRGVVLLGVLAFIFMTSLAASALVNSFQQAAKRENEEQLLFAGDQFRKAIVSYYNTVPPGGARSLPPSLDALLQDNRLASPRQHLRRMYPDPMTGTNDWELITVQGRVAGVRSRSVGQPLKKAGFPKMYQAFEAAQTYADWQFAVSP